MLSLAERRAKRKALENDRRRRIENLRKIAEYAGSIDHLAKLLGLNAELLHSMIGQNATRAIEDRMARDIEFALDLQQGYLDQDHRKAEPR